MRKQHRNLSDTARFAQYLAGSKNGAIFAARDTLMGELRSARKSGDKHLARAALKWLKMTQGELELRYQISTLPKVVK